MKHILVEDAREQQRETFLSLLKENGFDCVEAKNETAALSQLATYPFDLVISNLAPPFVESSHFLHVWNKRALLKTTKAIFITFNPSEEARN